MIKIIEPVSSAFFHLKAQIKSSTVFPRNFIIPTKRSSIILKQMYRKFTSTLSRKD